MGYSTSYAYALHLRYRLCPNLDDMVPILKLQAWMISIILSNGGELHRRSHIQRVKSIGTDTLDIYPTLCLFCLLCFSSDIYPHTPSVVFVSIFLAFSFLIRFQSLSSQQETQSIDLPPAWRLMKAFHFHSFTILYTWPTAKNEMR
jgi:hypothetical protein